MIVVNSGIMQEKIKKIVLANKDYAFTFLKKEGVRLCFEVDGDEQAAAASAKKDIKADAICSGLILSVKVEE